jgi:membrane-associated phospholipid phosphatase
MKRLLAICLLCVSICESMEAHHPLREQVAVAVTSYGTLRLTVYPTKHLVNERRPDGTDCKSFPSGHTATAFLAAEMVREEYGNTWGAGAYLVAAGVGLQRIYKERHWPHDVLAGAAIGFFSARVGYWLLPLERRWFGWNKSEERKHDAPTIVLVPSYNPELRAPSLSFAASF